MALRLFPPGRRRNQQKLVETALTPWRRRIVKRVLDRSRQHLSLTVEAALQQMYPSRKILVVDDGSTDERPAILAPYRDAITYIRQPNLGWRKWSS